MKLRTRSGSLRFRLSQSEVATLAKGGELAEVVDVAPGAALVFRLVTRADALAIGAQLAGTTLTIALPAALAEEWASSDRVGLEATQAVEGRSALTILVEKDFACLAPRAGDEDAFPHPGAGRGVTC